jgi:hypothetical protein
MMTDRRLVDPKKFAHVRQELGIDPLPRTTLRETETAALAHADSAPYRRR